MSLSPVTLISHRPTPDPSPNPLTPLYNPQPLQPTHNTFTPTQHSFLSVYMPITKISLQLILCDQKAYVVQFFGVPTDHSNSTSSEYAVTRPGKLSCWESMELTLFIYASVFVLATFIIPLPVLLVRLIQRNKPTGTPEDPDVIFDVDGERVEVGTVTLPTLYCVLYEQLYETIY